MSRVNFKDFSKILTDQFLTELTENHPLPSGHLHLCHAQLLGGFLLGITMHIPKHDQRPIPSVQLGEHLLYRRSPRVRGLLAQAEVGELERRDRVALERAGIKAPSRCRAGECGWCRSRLLEGTVFIPQENEMRRWADKQYGYIHPCCSFPTSDLVLEVPGEFFAYCNMNYCLLGSVIENVSGKRFDVYMKDHVFGPMGLSCSYNVSAMPEAVQAQVGTLYRKLDASGNCDPENGIWTAQCDDFSAGFPREDYREYVIGTNGSLFGPMGSLRISVRELCKIMEMFCHGGSANGVQILKPETIGRMFTPVWTYDPSQNNGDTYLGMMKCYGMGPHIFTNSNMGDKIVPWQDLPFAGHTADAYGLLGGMLFDREKGNGIVYIVAGTGSDKNEYWGKYSAFYGWEEQLLTAAAEYAQFDY